MTDIVQALQNGTANLWLFIPSAVLLGALHGLEPGHSKTMMAAFIIAVRGTIAQAVLLGLSAAVSHSLIIWLLAALALQFGNQWNAESAEPYLQIGSAVIILGLAVWMFLRTRRELQEEAAHHHDHCHSELFVFDTGHGKLELSVFEDGVPPVFRLRDPGGRRTPSAKDVTLETIRPDGTRQTFVFKPKDGFLESTEAIPEPHEFDADVTITHGGHSHVNRIEFRESAHHHHHSNPQETGYQDAHERAHASEIERRFAGRNVTTPQIILFGITGGLMPCPAAFSILLICLQLKRATLGFSLVGAFSSGLALTMVTVGALAAWSVRHAQKRFRNFGSLMRRAPYVSCALLVLIALYMGVHGWHGLHP